MPPEQLRLFGHPKPLLDRLGPAFFQKIPPRPGVYIMTAPDDRVLYIGQSKNLRKRLASYKNAHPERSSRKVIRLIHATHRIVWEECPSAEAARLRENELLRLHRPRFNVLNTYPQAYVFIGLCPESRALEIFWTRGLTDRGQLYGAFKRSATLAHAALVRTIWTVSLRPRSTADYPLGLLAGQVPARFRVEAAPAEIHAALPRYLEGTSSCLVDHLDALAQDEVRLDSFCLGLLRGDLERLREFYQYGPRRNYMLRQKAEIESACIPQDELDDLLVSLGRTADSTASP